MCTDWDNKPPTLRKALTFKEASELHLNCGMFCYYMDAIAKEAPAEDYKNSEDKLKEQFLSGVLDVELTLSAQSTVPPGDPKSIGVFRCLAFA